MTGKGNSETKPRLHLERENRHTHKNLSVNHNQISLQSALFLNLRHSCMSLPAKTINMMKLFHPTVFHFLQKLPNGREIFQTRISSAGKSYDRLPKYRKSVQTDCMSSAPKDYSHSTDLTHLSSKPELSPGFPNHTEQLIRRQRFKK